MRRPMLFLFAAAACLSTALQAQVADSSPFRRLELPTPNAFRAASGAPGSRYWQNRADYRLEARVDTATRVLTGSSRIRYTNHSPDTLAFLWLQLDQEIFSPGSINRSAPPPPLLFAGAPFDMAVNEEGGLALESLTVPGQRVTLYKWDTMLRVDLERPLAPGDTLAIEAAWHFRIPVNGVARMGRDGNLYEIAQWYPRMAVYDDVHGWNTLPYIGSGEFYLEYGDFDLRITAPWNYVVAATGELQNPEEVLTEAQRARLRRAMAGDDAVAVITRAEAGTSGARLMSRAADGTLTWHFTSRDVRDVAFAMAPNFRWDAVRYDAGNAGIKLVQTFYRPDAQGWEDAARMALHAIRTNSERWQMYAWPQVSAIEGPIQGMEYPMMVFVPADVPHGLSWVLMHELGHEWFPMMVGSDERRHPWMDEGFNSFIDLYTVADWWRTREPGHADSVLNGPLGAYAENAVPGREQPLSTIPTESRTLYWTAYQKPALMLKLLREEVLDTAVFDRALREYQRRWHFRHPQPADFFRTIENVSGRNLDWFWREWVFQTARLDQSVDSVLVRGDSARVVLGYRREMVMPAEVLLGWSDGTRETRRIPVEMWNYGRHHAFKVALNGRRLVGVEVDPRHVYPDMDRRNNRWQARGR
jgi:hypothetical protein